MKIRGDWEKLKCEGAYKISWGFEKIEGQGFKGACYRGVFHRTSCLRATCSL